MDLEEKKITKVSNECLWCRIILTLDFKQQELKGTKIVRPGVRNKHTLASDVDNFRKYINSLTKFNLESLENDEETLNSIMRNYFLFYSIIGSKTSRATIKTIYNELSNKNKDFVTRNLKELIVNIKQELNNEISENIKIDVTNFFINTKKFSEFVTFFQSGKIFDRVEKVVEIFNYIQENPSFLRDVYNLWTNSSLSNEQYEFLKGATDVDYTSEKTRFLAYFRFKNEENFDIKKRKLIIDKEGVKNYKDLDKNGRVVAREKFAKINHFIKELTEEVNFFSKLTSEDKLKLRKKIYFIIYSLIPTVYEDLYLKSLLYVMTRKNKDIFDNIKSAGLILQNGGTDINTSLDKIEHIFNNKNEIGEKLKNDMIEPLRHFEEEYCEDDISSIKENIFILFDAFIDSKMDDVKKIINVITNLNSSLKKEIPKSDK